MKTPEVTAYSINDDVLHDMQRASFDYFLYEASPASGLIRDKTACNWPCSIAAVGMALTVLPIGVEREFIKRANATERVLTTLRFFANSEQSTSPDATGYKGFYYHFLDMESGRRASNSELSSLDTGILMAGVLSAVQYFTGDNDAEKEIRLLGAHLYERVDWQWMRGGNVAICLGWT